MWVCLQELSSFSWMCFIFMEYSSSQMTPCWEGLCGMSPHDRTLISEPKSILHLVHVLTQSPLQVLSFKEITFLQHSLLTACLQLTCFSGKDLSFSWHGFAAFCLSLNTFCLLPLSAELSPYCRVEEVIDIEFQQIFTKYLLCQALG